jgi:hypothetical protein
MRGVAAVIEDVLELGALADDQAASVAAGGVGVLCGFVPADADVVAVITGSVSTRRVERGVGGGAVAGARTPGCPGRRRSRPASRSASRALALRGSSATKVSGSEPSKISSPSSQISSCSSRAGCR